LKCVAGEGWKRPFGPIVRNEEILHRDKEERNVPHTIKRRRVKVIGSCVGTAF
jgi:hypothetical protein